MSGNTGRAGLRQTVTSSGISFMQHTHLVCTHSAQTTGEQTEGRRATGLASQRTESDVIHPLITRGRGGVTASQRSQNTEMGDKCDMSVKASDVCPSRWPILLAIWSNPSLCREHACVSEGCMFHPIPVISASWGWKASLIFLKTSCLRFTAHCIPLKTYLVEPWLL